MDELEGLVMSEPGEQTVQGRSFAVIRASGGLVYRVWAPLSANVIAVNRALKSDADLINRDPFGAGWLIRVIPTNLEGELQSLTARYVADAGRQ
jgi:glycine cleavage system H protein